MDLELTQMTINPAALYCFLDTDVLMQFTTFDQVDWLKFFDAQQVQLVLPITVVYELNKHKDDGSKPHLQERAKKLLSLIFKLLAGTNGPVCIREGVFLVTIPREPIIGWSSMELDQEVRDDRILARIILFKQQHPDVEVCFLTNDHSSVIKAIDRNIRAITPDGQMLEQINLKSSIEAKLQATQKELNDLKNRLPKLDFGFDTGQALTKVITYPYPHYDTLNVTVLSTSLTDNYTPYMVNNQRKKLEQILSISEGHASDYQLKEFTKEYEKYLKELEPALKRTLMSAHGQLCNLAFGIKNIGTAPATDIRLDLCFPDGTLIIDANDVEQEIKIPEEPKPTWTIKQPSAFGMGSFVDQGIFKISHNVFPSSLNDPAWHLLRLQNATQATFRGPLCNKTEDSHVVLYRAKKLQQEDVWKMPPIIAFLIPTNKQGFSIDYSISIDESSKKIQGELSVKWKI